MTVNWLVLCSDRQGQRKRVDGHRLLFHLRATMHLDWTVPVMEALIVCPLFAVSRRPFSFFFFGGRVDSALALLV